MVNFFTCCWCQGSLWSLAIEAGSPNTQTDHAQPICPDGTCVTKLSSINFAPPCTAIILPRVGFYVVVVVFRLCLTRSGWSEFGLDTRKSDTQRDIFRDIPNDRNHLNRSRNARFLPKARIKSRRHEERSEPRTRQGIRPSLSW